MSKYSKILLGIIGIIALALGSSWLGATLSGGTSTGSGGSGSESGAWLQKIRDSGELRVGIGSAPPTSSEQEDGTMGGPSVWPLEVLAEELGVEFVPVSAEFSNMVAGLQAGRFDAAAGIDPTTERSFAIQFTDPVFSYEGVFIVKDGSGLTSLDNILADGGAIGVASGTAFEVAVQDLGAPIQTADTMPQTVTNLQSGRTIAAFGDMYTMADAVDQNPELKIVRPDPIIYKSGVSIGLPEDIDPRSLQVLNIAIQNALDNGTQKRAMDEAGVIDPEDLGDYEAR